MNKIKMIGVRILENLREANMTQAQLARKVGVDAAQMSRWCNGKGNPTIKTIMRIEEVLNANIITV